jgi:hypothetical protein
MAPVLTPTGSDTTQPTINRQIIPAIEQIDTDRTTPHMEVYHINPKKRQQLRGLLINSQPFVPNEKARQGRSNGSSLSDHKRKTFHADLDEFLRWNTFLVHSGLNLPEVVDYISDLYNANEQEYQRALTKAVELHDSLKTTTCNNLQKHAAALLQATPDLRELDNVTLTQKISDSSSLDRFFAAFNYTEDYLDYGGSSPMGKWYAKGIYVNMTRTLV